jgi:hypothetical protein
VLLCCAHQSQNIEVTGQPRGARRQVQDLVTVAIEKDIVADQERGRSPFAPPQRVAIELIESSPAHAQRSELGRCDGIF